MRENRGRIGILYGVPVVMVGAATVVLTPEAIAALAVNPETAAILSGKLDAWFMGTVPSTPYGQAFYIGRFLSNAVGDAITK